jgi:hypothetical protein
MPSSHIVQVLLLVATSVCLLALWKGSSAERFGAAIILINLAFELFGVDLIPTEFRPTLRLVMDGLTAMSLLGIALWYASLWLGGAMMLFAVQFSLHSYYIVTNRPTDYLHAVVNNLDYMGIIICLAVGAGVSWRRRVLRRRALAAPPAAEPTPPSPLA